MAGPERSEHAADTGWVISEGRHVTAAIINPPTKWPRRLRKRELERTGKTWNALNSKLVMLTCHLHLHLLFKYPVYMFIGHMSSRLMRGPALVSLFSTDESLRDLSMSEDFLWGLRSETKALDRPAGVSVPPTSPTSPCGRSWGSPARRSTSPPHNWSLSHSRTAPRPQVWCNT